MAKKVAIGCDPNAMAVKDKLKEALAADGYEIADFGSEDPIYANTAFAVAKRITEGDCDSGILICGTGIGMSVAANKVNGIYAALLTDPYSAERARKSNNANIACFGAFTLGYRVIESLARTFLNAEYKSGTPSEEKVNRIASYEKTRN